jgi:isopentenyl-diphosphate delta-isomerase
MQRPDKSDEVVVLVDDDDREIGTALKSEVHDSNTPLHRAFSLFLFDRPSPEVTERYGDRRVLVTQRALTKKTWPGVWSNSVCGHPAPGESREEAIVRRVREELGCGVKELEKVADYRYRFSRGGVVEHEICPIFVGVIEGELKPDQEEVEDWEWMEWEEFRKALDSDKSGVWSEWCKEEAQLVEVHFGRSFAG